MSRRYAPGDPSPDFPTHIKYVSTALFCSPSSGPLRLQNIEITGACRPTWEIRGGRQRIGVKNSGRKFERLSLKDTIFESAKPATAMLTLTTESPKVAEDALW
eukprot:scaffold47840_cov29-Phaeocystis_antarctica.AAC.2